MDRIPVSIRVLVVSDVTVDDRVAASLAILIRGGMRDLVLVDLIVALVRMLAKEFLHLAGFQNLLVVVEILQLLV